MAAPSRTSRLIDCSHEIVDAMTTYPGLPGPAITTHLSREDTAQRMAPGISFQIGRIDMVANTGTYIDSPWHFHAEGADLAGLALAQTANLPAVVAHVTGVAGGIGPDALPPGPLEGHAVLFHTGWDRHWRTAQYGESAPHLTRALVERLLAEEVVLVGIDSVNIDSIEDLTRPAHHGFLGAGIPIVEHLTHLDELPGRGARFFAVPPKVSGFGTFPVRAFAIIPE
jgi:kynurenine formamidase